MRKGISGQYVYFSLVSAISGNPVTGASGAISGRKSLDGLSGMIVLSGNIIELGGGSYRANLFDFDTNGNQAGFLFTSSGTVPVQYHFDMIDGNASGAVWPASGVNVTVPIASISGNVSNSGLFTTVLPANLSGVVANSGLFASVLPANLSGVFASVLPANLSGVVANSGLFATVLPENLSGVVANSGLFATILKANISGVVANSGLFTTAAVDPATLSGVFATVLPANLSGVIANSGLFTTVLPENISGVIANSGLFVTVLKATISGVVANSGLSVTTTASVASGSLYLASGSVFVNTFSSGTLNQMAINNAALGLSGIENLLPAQSPGAAALKLTSRFNAPSGTTYNADGTTVFMNQQVTTASSQQPIIQLGAGVKP